MIPLLLTHIIYIRIDLLHLLDPTVKNEDFPEADNDWIAAVAELTTAKKLDAILQENALSVKTTQIKAKRIEQLLNFLRGA